MDRRSVDLKRIEDFLESLPAHGDERKYHRAILQIVTGIEYASSDVITGVALVEFLASVPWEGAGYNCYNDGISGSRQEAATFVSAAFCDGRYSASWWWNETLQSNCQEVSPRIRWWEEQFRGSPLVQRVC